METIMHFNTVLHPGVYLNEMLQAEGMSQKELAIRTGTTEKHISTVITGKKGISAFFAKKLEFVFSKPMTYWMQKQAEYDSALLEFKEKHGIDAEEIEILASLKDVSDFLQKNKLIEAVIEKPDMVLEFRKFMGVSSLKVIPSISYKAAYRAQVTKNANVNPYVLYAWKRICETYVSNISIPAKLDVELLQRKLTEIKKLMFCSIDHISQELTTILAECGIAFKVVPHFRGAPVQGFISKRSDEKLMLCVTLRQKRADKFWFTLFHEIGHIVNGDVDTKFVDFDSAKNEAEGAADLFACNALVDSAAYRAFWKEGDFSLENIKLFAKNQNVKPFIIIGRLQAEGELEWNEFSNEMAYYEWATGSI